MGHTCYDRRMKKKPKAKKGKLAAAASKKLQSIGGPKMTPEDVAHVMFHAEQRGEVERRREEG